MNAMTLAQLTEYHRIHHVGYVWQCPYCKDAYWKAKREESHETVPTMQKES